MFLQIVTWKQNDSANDFVYLLSLLLLFFVVVVGGRSGAVQNERQPDGQQYRGHHNGGETTPLNEPIKHDFYQFYTQPRPQNDVTAIKVFDIFPNDSDLRPFWFITTKVVESIRCAQNINTHTHTSKSPVGHAGNLSTARYMFFFWRAPDKAVISSGEAIFNTRGC